MNDAAGTMWGELLLGLLAFCLTLVLGVTVALERLTQRNYEFVRYWESLSREPRVPVQTIDRGKRKAKGLAHRRRMGEDVTALSFASSVLREGSCALAARSVKNSLARQPNYRLADDVCRGAGQKLATGWRYDGVWARGSQGTCPRACPADRPIAPLISGPGAPAAR